MADTPVGERLASLETSQKGIQKAQEAAVTAMDKMNDNFKDYHSELMDRLDVIRSNQEIINDNQSRFNKFQERTEAENTANVNRLNSLEEHNRTQAAVRASEKRYNQMISAAIAALISFIGWLIVMAIDWIKK